MRALIVDDSSLQRSAMVRLLEELGIETETARDGLEGLERLRADPQAFGLALVDWNMPMLSGVELVEALRSDARFTRLRLVMASTEDSPERIERALEAGADEYLIKPFSLEELASKLDLLGLADGDDDGR